MTSEVLIRGLALLIAACGIYLLQAVWRSKHSKPLWLLSGWGLIIASTVMWAATSGADKGAALGIIAIIVLALAALLIQASKSERRVAKIRPQRIVDKEKTHWLKVLRRIWVGFLIGPLAGLAALALCTAMFPLFRGFGMEHTINLTLVSFAFPFLWGGIAVFAGFETRLLRKSLGVIGLGILPLTYLITAA
ncbi:MAG: hypothetical protein AAGG45_06190 [Pseudomonadota bacterium]